MRIELLLLCGSCAFFPPLLLSQEVRYTITDLAEGTNQFGTVYALNTRGDVVGDADFHAAMWSRGTMTIPASLGNAFSTARGINDLGQVVGGTAPNGTSVAFLFDHSVVTNLAVPSGTTYSLAVAINNHGQTLVNTQTASGFGAFLRTQGAPQPIASPVINVVASALNQTGQVVGESWPAGASLGHAFLWSDGQMIDLGVLPGGEAAPDCGFCAAGNFSVATAINDSGVIVGQSVAGGQELHAFVWRGDGMEDLGTLPADNRSYAAGINDRGQIVGWSGHVTGVIIDSTRAVLWDNATALDLTDLIPSGTGWVLDMAVAINSRGQIVGNGHRNELGRPFLLNPIRKAQPAGSSEATRRASSLQ